MFDLTTLVETREGVQGRVWSRSHPDKLSIYAIKLENGTLKHGYPEDELKKVGGTLARKDRHGVNIPACV